MQAFVPLLKHPSSRGKWLTRSAPFLLVLSRGCTESVGGSSLMTHEALWKNITSGMPELVRGLITHDFGLSRLALSWWVCEGSELHGANAYPVSGH